MGTSDRQGRIVAITTKTPGDNQRAEVGLQRGESQVGSNNFKSQQGAGPRCVGNTEEPTESTSRTCMSRV